jgi:hypothetical protein
MPRVILVGHNKAIYIRNTLSYQHRINALNASNTHFAVVTCISFADAMRSNSDFYATWSACRSQRCREEIQRRTRRSIGRNSVCLGIISLSNRRTGHSLIILTRFCMRSILFSRSAVERSAIPKCEIMTKVTTAPTAWYPTNPGSCNCESS